MKSLDNLRRCFDGFTFLSTTTAKRVVNEKADEIESELKKRYAELPLDKDEVPIHVGDEMVSCGKHRFRFIVSELDFTDAFVHAVGIVGGVKYFFKPSEIVHYHKNPIEYMLRNLVTKARQIDVDGSPMLKESDIRELSDKLQLKEE